jgi:hypothetical protein
VLRERRFADELADTIETFDEALLVDDKFGGADLTSVFFGGNLSTIMMSSFCAVKNELIGFVEEVCPLAS